MTPFVQDEDFTLYVGDVRDVLTTMPDESVHCVVTSPPYWGLRDYGTGSWNGGDADCDHVGRTGGGPPGSDKQASNKGANGVLIACPCGARRTDKQLGLEPTPDEYVANMVAVFREVRRVLRRDGTCWLNIGDSYAGSMGGGRGDSGRDIPRNGQGGSAGMKNDGERFSRGLAGLKPKDLVGIPWRLAFALQADGWYLRSDIIWSKPNPMPESVTDRPTKAHEYLFLLTRSPRYFYDADAIREDALYGRKGSADAAGTLRRAGGDPERAKNGDATWKGCDPSAGRNRRSVWEIATEPYPDAHFATFPQALVEPCVLAGTSEKGCCPVCGAPWERETEQQFVKLATRRDTRKAVQPGADMADVNSRNEMGYNRTTTTGWHPACDCGRDGSKSSLSSKPHPPVPCTVLDPFMGSGTTAQVARRLGRKSIGIELNHEYAQLAATRLQQLSLLAEPYEPRPAPQERPRGLTGGAYSPPGQSPHSNAR